MLVRFAIRPTVFKYKVAENWTCNERPKFNLNTSHSQVRYIHCTLIPEDKILVRFAS